jgi:hypothetical protein
MRGPRWQREQTERQHMSVTYNDNAVPVGSIVAAVKTGPGAGTSVGSYVLESLTLNYESAVIKRKDEIGKQNGFTIVKTGGGTGSGVMQIATASTARPDIGSWFSFTPNGGTGGVAEQWVIASYGQPFGNDAYYKITVNLDLSPNPPAS